MGASKFFPEPWRPRVNSAAVADRRSIARRMACNLNVKALPVEQLPS